MFNDQISIKIKKCVKVTGKGTDRTIAPILAALNALKQKIKEKKENEQIDRSIKRI